MARWVDPYEEEYRRWARLVSKKDPLLDNKKEALECAVYLGYSEEVLTKIIQANKGLHIDNILHDARCA